MSERRITITITAYKNLYPGAVIGYSGHEEGVVESVAAVAAGAKIIERHITLHHSLKGSDHASSLNPVELRYFVKSIKIVEQAMGKFQKENQVCELDCYAKYVKANNSELKFSVHIQIEICMKQNGRYNIWRRTKPQPHKPEVCGLPKDH
ncbi:Sialic acid synthase like protein [Argiope bruennichi]|uniref:Sialic acid synthase like protein n=1 Tax=Argiope bruennichi TaxID=94029 RepID=A0A8T0F2X4_ARGBR|nr:Sialic acid synthase like protein [Argiope bruennichi]